MDSGLRRSGGAGGEGIAVPVQIYGLSEAQSDKRSGQPPMVATSPRLLLWNV